MKDIQIVFSNDTKVIELDEKEVYIDNAAFEFYDLGDLKDLSKQSTYLTGKHFYLSSCDTYITLK